MSTATAERHTPQAPKLRYSGTVGLCVPSEVSRFSPFVYSLRKLRLPAGWDVMAATNYSETRNRNWLVENFQGEWLWFIDDDHTFPPDTLERLLAHDVPVVGGFCLQRQDPFAPVAFRDGHRLDPAPNPGLEKVDATGAAGLLVHRKVFDALEPPWFFHEEETEGSKTSDVLFCEKARAAGFPIHVDTSLPIGHLNVFSVSPRFDGVRWSRSMVVGNKEVARF